MNNAQEAIRNLIFPLFKDAAGGPYTVYLYGSRAAGGARVDSDTDFAVFGPAPLDHEELERIRDSLIDLLGDVDCVDMRRIPLTLAAQVLDSGIVLLPGDDAERARLETRLMSMYANLNEERNGIIADIVKRGSVYA
jgi:predicted nucleotidyltransferase